MRFLLAAALALVVLSAALTPAWAKLGDVNCTEDLPNAVDALLLLQVSAGYLAAEDLSCPENADVDDSGRVDVVDALRILQMVFNVEGVATPTLVPPVTAVPA